MSISTSWRLDVLTIRMRFAATGGRGLGDGCGLRRSDVNAATNARVRRQCCNGPGERVAAVREPRSNSRAGDPAHAVNATDLAGRALDGLPTWAKARTARRGSEISAGQRLFGGVQTAANPELGAQSTNNADRRADKRRSQDARARRGGRLQLRRFLLPLPFFLAFLPGLAIERRIDIADDAERAGCNEDKRVAT